MINWFILKKKKTGKNRNKFGKIKRTRLRLKKKPSMWMVDGGVCKRQRAKKGGEMEWQTLIWWTVWRSRELVWRSRELVFFAK